VWLAPQEWSVVVPDTTSVRRFREHGFSNTIGPVASENTAAPGREQSGTASEKKPTRRRGRSPTPLPTALASVLEQYATELSRADMTVQARRTYLSRVRMYLSWLGAAAVDGDPLTDAAAAAWAARDYKAYL
jgi:hypothetical protein